MKRVVFKKYRVSDKRTLHMESVACEMEKFASRFGIDKKKAVIAGLYHDLARDLPSKEVKALAAEASHVPDKYERSNPMLLHTYASAMLIQKERLSDDNAVLKAVCEHAVGSMDMSPLSKLLYVVDFAEPLREYVEAKEVYTLLDTGLDRALLKAVTISVKYIMDSGRVVHPDSLKLYNKLTGGICER